MADAQSDKQMAENPAAGKSRGQELLERMLANQTRLGEISHQIGQSLNALRSNGVLADTARFDEFAKERAGKPLLDFFAAMENMIVGYEEIAEDLAHRAAELKRCF